MSIGEIEVRVRQTEERGEIHAACSQLIEAHQEVSCFERRAQEDAEKLADARIQMAEAVRRMDTVLATFRRAQ